jgi:hypothetical protein
MEFRLLDHQITQIAGPYYFVEQNQKLVHDFIGLMSSTGGCNFPGKTGKVAGRRLFSILWMPIRRSK